MEHESIRSESRAEILTKYIRAKHLLEWLAVHGSQQSLGSRETRDTLAREYAASFSHERKWLETQLPEVGCD